jgi:hypothetical protein
MKNSARFEEMYTESWKKRVRELGEYLGFPDCCIDEFVNRRGHPGPRKLLGTGYVPCASCNNKTEHELVDQIDLNRKCPVPFPEY